jgi:hypothetical protein
MIGQLHKNLPPGGVTRLGPIWEFHWPGDQARGSLPVAMIKGYKKSLGEVEKVGELLAQFLGPWGAEMRSRCKSSDSSGGPSFMHLRGLALAAARW